MRDGIRMVNNPFRVPDTLTIVDRPQEGAARVIHPVGILVGTPLQEATPVDLYRSAEPETFEVPGDGTYMDDRGNPIAYRKGDRIPLARAARFSDFEVAPPAPTDARALLSAPENRMESAPENRSGAFVAEDDLTPAQKAARTRAQNKAREDAGTVISPDDVPVPGSETADDETTE